MDILDTLNPKQREAVILPAEHALILAGAGSGKTRVLTTRIAWLLSTGKAKPWEILAVTFTNKAAREMKTRLEAMLGASVESMWVGTFHGICHKLLRRHAAEAGLPQTFQIIDQSDQLSLVKGILKRKHKEADNDVAKTHLWAINHEKERGIRAAHFPRTRFNDETAEIYSSYEALCRREGLVDFAELLLSSVELFEGNELLREHYANRFKFILIDEFQDTNALQYRWIKALSHPNKSEGAVFCVGDDDQSIYAFRGARVDNMTDFVNEYGVKHVVKLEQNYRSTSHILNAANAVIANNRDRLGKNLWTSAGDGTLVGLYECMSANEEAHTLTQEIMSRHRLGTRFSDFAVLYRNNAQSRIIEKFLMSNMVPYRIYGGLRFFDRQEIKDVLAYLRLVAHPDDVNFERVINKPTRGIGEATLAKITERAQAQNISLWSALIAAINTKETSGLSRAIEFVHLIEKMRLDYAKSNLEDLVKGVIKDSGLYAYYENQQDKTIRLENLDELIQAAATYAQENGLDKEQSAMSVHTEDGLSALDGFLAQCTLESEGRNSEAGSDAVQLMTVHASKGLEFDTVFLCGLEEGTFPHKAQDQEDPKRKLAEERRLLYVAITRAKKHLRISWCRSRLVYGGHKDFNRSSFLEEIPEADSVWLNEYGEKIPTFESMQLGKPFHSYRRNTEVSASKTAYGRVSDTLFTFNKTRAVGSNPWNLNTGDKVRHKKFGDGIVLRLTNAQSEDVATAWIDFRGQKKELLLKLAKLEKLS